MDSSQEETTEQAISAEEVARRKAAQKAARRTVATGRFQVPPDWTPWRKRCGANRRGKGPCQSWAVVGMPTCRLHGSGGEVNRQLGQLRYLAWIVLGGPQNMPIEHACRLALAMYAEYIFSPQRRNDEKTLNMQIKAAQWLMQLVPDE